MVNSHTIVAIAQTAFYVPIVPITWYVFIRNWNNRPRMAWYPLATFSLVRFIGGIVAIILASHPDSIGLTITAIVLLNIGLIPLIISVVGLIRQVTQSTFKDSNRVQRIIKFIRIAIMATIALLVTSGALTSSSNSASTRTALAKIGYVILAVVLGLEIVVLTRYHRQEAQILGHDIIYVRGALLSMPALILRTVYGLLYEFTPNSLFSTWSPLFGSAVAFALMALLPEYIALLIYLHLGFHRIRTCSKQRLVSSTEEMPIDSLGV